MTRRKRPTKTAMLQAQWDAIPDLMDAEILYRPFKGWFAVPFEPRWFYDDGDHLGMCWRDATLSLEWLARREARYAQVAA